MFETLFQRPTVLARYCAGPLADARERFLEQCVTRGYSRSMLQKIAWVLLALADGIERLLADREFARKLAAAGQEYVRTHHAASQMAETVANTYRQILSGRPTLPATEESA